MRSTRLPSSIERLLGLDPLAAPPHVFSVDGFRLSYGKFLERDAGFDFCEFQRTALAGDTYQSGPLGGPIRDQASFTEQVASLLEAISGPVEEASIVLPDRWLRLIFAEISDLPGAPRAREEVLRWKLKRLVPFRVEELRIKGEEVRPLPGQEEPRRVLLGFAIELLLSQLEQAFEENGVHVGRITNESLALSTALQRTVEEGLTALALVAEDGYSLIFAQSGEPLFYRYKGLNRGAQGATLTHLVSRDLTLTRSFLDEKLPDRPLGKVLVAAPRDQEAGWMEWLRECLQIEPEALEAWHLPLAGEGYDGRWHETAPMLGAACAEVS